MNDQRVSYSQHSVDEPGRSPDEFGLLDMLEAVAGKLRLIVVGSMLVGLVALAVAFFIPPTFTAVARFLPPQQQQSGAASLLQSLGAVGGLASAASGLKNPIDQYVSFLKTRTVQEALVTRFDLQKRYANDSAEDARLELEGATRVGSGKDNIIAVEVDDADPKFAADLANAYVEELKSLINGLALTEAQQRRRFFENQMQATKEHLVKAEQALGASGVGIATLNVSPGTAVDAIARIRAQITVTEVRLAAMRSYLTDTAPELRQALGELSALRGQLTRAEQDQPAGASKSGNDYIARFREFKYQETLFDLFARQYEIAKVDESREGSVIQVIDAAKPPERKAKPRKAIIAITAALTAAVVLVFSILALAMWKAVISRDDERAQRVGRVQQALRRSVFGRS